MTRTVAAPAGERYPRLDALRGAAVVWMVGFHFCFDLNHFGWLSQDFYNDPRWTVQRACIVSLFLFCAGIGQAIAISQAQRWPRFWRRWGQIAACALLVTLGSWFVFPASVITFGVLHAVAVMLIVVRLTAGAGPWLWLAGALAIAAPWFVQHPVFDGRALNWVGLVTRRPVTEDYVPLLPWLGAMWWGVAAGQWLLARRRHWLAGPLPEAARGLVPIGQWSLTVYMVHQPVFFALLAGMAAVRGA